MMVAITITRRGGAAVPSAFAPGSEIRKHRNYPFSREVRIILCRNLGLANDFRVMITHSRTERTQGPRGFTIQMRRMGN